MSERSQPAAVRAAGPGALAAGDPARPAVVPAGRSPARTTRRPPPRTASARSSRPAARGEILDARGRPLVRNRTALVVSVSRTALLRQPDGGSGVLAQGRDVIGKPADDGLGQAPGCAGGRAPPAPAAGTARPTSRSRSPTRPTPRWPLQIMERREDFPGVTAELTAVRDYPRRWAQRRPRARLPRPGQRRGARARGAEYAARSSNETALRRTDLIGRAGVERQYDDALRGRDGRREAAVDHRGGVSGACTETRARRRATPGAVHRRARSRRVAEKRAAARRSSGPAPRGAHRAAQAAQGRLRLGRRDGGQDRRLVAMASYPSYDPKVFVGGVCTEDYGRSRARGALPDQSRAIQGAYAPASTFKVVTLPAAVQAATPCTGRYHCPRRLIGAAGKRNFDSPALGMIDCSARSRSPATRSSTSSPTRRGCATGGYTPTKSAKDPLAGWRKAFGLGKPHRRRPAERAAGRIADRAYKQACWEETRDNCCAKAAGQPGGRPQGPAARGLPAHCRRSTATTATASAAATRRTSRSGRATPR